MRFSAIANHSSVANITRPPRSGEVSSIPVVLYVGSLVSMAKYETAQS